MTLYLSCFLHIGDNSKSALSQDEDDLLAEELLHVVVSELLHVVVSEVEKGVTIYAPTAEQEAVVAAFTELLNCALLLFFCFVIAIFCFSCLRLEQQTADANAFTVSTTNGALSLSSLSNASKNDFIMKRATKVAQGSLYGAIGRAMGYRVNGNIIMRPSTIRENIMSHRYH